MNDRYITIHEIIDMLNICRTSIYTWSKNGYFPKPRKFGRASRWSLKEIEDWAQNRPVGSYGEGK